MEQRRVTRKSHYKGQHVRITFKNGETCTGRISGWGPQILAIRPTDGGRHGWKVESYGVTQFTKVEEI